MKTAVTAEEVKSRNWIYILSGFIALLLGANIYLFMNQGEKEQKLTTIVDEKRSLQLELDNLKGELAEVRGNNATLSTGLEAEEKELAQKIIQMENALRKNKLTAAELTQARKEIASLRQTMNQYIDNIAVLTKEKDQLSGENQGLRSSVDAATAENKDLSTKNADLNNMVNRASALKAAVVTVKTFKRRSSGKLVDNSKAKSVDKLVSELVIAPNDLAREGMYEVYMQLVDPNGNTVAPLTTEPTHKPLVINGNQVDYTTSTNISYTKSASNYSIDWINSEGWAPGNYTVNLFSEGIKIGSTTFSLK